MKSAFLVSGDVPSPSAGWEMREGPFVIHGEGTPPRTETATGWAECRSERAFALLIGTVAAQLPEPVRVLDGDGVLWPASRVDPDRVRL